MLFECDRLWQGINGASPWSPMVLALSHGMQVGAKYACYSNLSKRSWRLPSRAGRQCCTARMGKWQCQVLRFWYESCPSRQGEMTLASFVKSTCYGTLL